MKRRILLALVVLVLAAGVDRLFHIGYFGGSPYTVVAARPGTARDTAAVYFSGDMGFETGAGSKVAPHLAAQGVTVIAVNSLAAFHARRTPAEAEALVAQAVTRALAVPGARRVLLIGQSFGANIVLAGAGALPPPLKARVAMVGLLVPGDTMLFHASPGGVLDFFDDGSALPYARRITDLPVLCIHGEAERDSLCPLWHAPNVNVVALPGDHFLHRDYALEAATLLRAARIAHATTAAPTRSAGA